MVEFSNLTNYKIPQGLFEELVKVIFKKEKKKGIVSVVLLTPKKIREINKRFRKKDKTTDVISFVYKEIKDNFISSEELGEVFLCPSEIKKQAKLLGSDFNTELKRSFIHGILHLVGYDHKVKKDLKLMISKEEEFLKKFKN